LPYPLVVVGAVAAVPLPATMTMNLTIETGVHWFGTKITGSKGRNMNKHQISQTVILALLAVAVSASEVTLPNEFVGGERARASEVNENFDAVKEAVDDNHARITALETGTVSVSVHAFNNFFDNDGCDFRRILTYGYFHNTTDSCIASAPVNLPHGATITGDRCVLYDNDTMQTAPSIYPVSLVRTNLITGVSEVIFSSISETLTMPGLQERTLAVDSGITNGNVVDNETYAYFLTVGFNHAGLAVSDNLRLYGCKLTYTLGD
jgi:hypothetical protein